MLGCIETLNLSGQVGKRVWMAKRGRHHSILRTVAGCHCRQVAEQLRDDIFRGHYRPHDRLPSEPGGSVAGTLSVGATVRMALDELVEHGLVYRHKGRGHVVRPPEPELLIQMHPSMAQECASAASCRPFCASMRATCWRLPTLRSTSQVERLPLLRGALVPRRRAALLADPYLPASRDRTNAARALTGSHADGRATRAVQRSHRPRTLSLHGAGPAQRTRGSVLGGTARHAWPRSRALAHRPDRSCCSSTSVRCSAAIGAVRCFRPATGHGWHPSRGSDIQRVSGGDGHA